MTTILKKLKKHYCKHEYHLLTKYEGVIYSKYETIYVIYCPRCESKKSVIKHDYEVAMEKRKVDNDYRNGRHEENGGSDNL